MTRTEADLVQVLERRAALVPADGVLLSVLMHRADGPVPVHRRPVTWWTAASAAVVAGVLLAVWAFVGAGRPSGVDTGGTISSNTTLATPRVFHAYNFRVDPSAGFAVQTRRIEATRQTIVFSADRAAGAIAGRPDVLEAVVHVRGGFDPTTVRRGSALTVNGTRGYYGLTPAHRVRDDGTESTQPTPSVAWTYAPDSWAVVSGTSAAFWSRPVELAVARAIHPGRPTTARLPFTVRYVPAGLRVTRLVGEGDLRPATAEGFGVTAMFGRGATATAVTIDALANPNQTVAGMFGSDHAPMTIAGRPAGVVTLRTGGRVDGHELSVIEDGYTVAVSGDRSVSVAELVLIAKRLVFVPAGTAPDRWTPAATALPHG